MAAKESYSTVITNRSAKYGLYALILFSLGSLITGNFAKGVYEGSIQLGVENFLLTLFATFLIVGGMSGAAVFTISLILLYIQYLWFQRSGKKSEDFQPANFTRFIVVLAIAVVATAYGEGPSTGLCCANVIFVFAGAYIVKIIWDFFSKSPKKTKSSNKKK
jgi:hypothetical protein